MAARAARAAARVRVLLLLVVDCAAKRARLARNSGFIASALGLALALEMRSAGGEGWREYDEGVWRGRKCLESE